MRRVIAALSLVMVGAVAAPASAETSGWARREGSSYEVGARRTDEAVRVRKRAIECTYTPVDIPADAQVYDADGSPIIVDGTGTWWEKACDDIYQLFTTTTLVYFTHNPEQLAQEARSRLVLPTVGVRTSPAGRTYVNAETWLWIDGATWRPVSASAEVPGLAVTVTATPVGVVWSTGDGHTVACDGPGTPYRPGDRPACAHVYRTRSDHAQGGEYTVTASVQWAVSWTQMGDTTGGGTFDDATTESPPASLRVVPIGTERSSGR